jgi:uracil-DNA glycosylase
VSGADEPPQRDRTSTVEWVTLVREIENCRRCALHRTRQHVVIYRGGGTPRVLFIGEAPGAAEDRTGLPFQGRAGQRLDRAIDRLGLEAGSFGIVNLIKCRPPANRYDRGAALACRPYLERQLAALAPERLVTLGSHALHALDPGAPPMMVAAGTPRSSRYGPLFPMIHPAAALRSRRRLARWETDVGALARWLSAARSQPV